MQEQSAFLTVREAAGLAGVGPAVVYRLVREGVIRAKRIGRKCIRIHRESFLEWLMSG
ncbi:MAG: helix-turn-helix domain-containing protein [Pelotomaculum sp.]|nr:helix-turn-helix domain-containing protein [Pelotomaculum sp.]